jgi:pimeloyl-ACP methyl ester carboxylesterase
MTTVQFVEVQGEPLAACLYEPTSSYKDDVVLVHGFTGSKEDFSLLAPLIADAGYRVLTFDNRGQHESSHTNREDGYSMRSLGRDVVEISKYFQLQKPHLLGHSFGGLVAQQAITLNPDNWSSLTLMCSGPSGQTNWFEDPQFKNLNNENKADIWREILEPERLGNIKFDIWKKRWLASDATATMTFRDHLLNQPSLITEISGLGISSHVIYGENDDAWPIEDQNEMAQDLQARLTVLPGCGHCPNEENPTLIARELIDFWSSN